MRTWGRVPKTRPAYSSAIGSFNIGNSPIGASDVDYEWVEVSTDANGFNDAVYLTTLAQVMAMNPGESPMFGNFGIPSQQAVQNQLPPDAAVMQTQQTFSAYFLALYIARVSANGDDPSYDVSVLANPGAILMNPVPI